jgi:hypothetical protein
VPQKVWAWIPITCTVKECAGSVLVVFMALGPTPEADLP